VPSFANMFGHPGIGYVPIVDLPGMRSALIWRRRDLHSVGRDFVATACAVIAAERHGNRRPGHADMSGHTRRPPSVDT
jgi:hypothetical protein